MIWIFILCAIIIVGILMMMLDNSFDELWKCIGQILTVVCSGTLLALIIIIIIVHSPTQMDIDKSEMLAKREALEYQLHEHIYLGDAVGEFNSELIKAQKRYQSPWTHWFYASWIMEIEPITFEGDTE